MPITDVQFDALLSWLNPDRDRAVHEYNRLHGRLTNFFKYESFSDTEADKLADDTIDLVAEKLVSSRLSNAGTDILDMPGLCARLTGEGVEDSLGLCRRVMGLLPEPAKEIVLAVTRITDFQGRGSPLFCSGDLKDLKRLARRLLDEECESSAYLRERFTPDALRQLRGLGDFEATPGALEMRLVGELNRIVTEHRLLEVEHFARIASECQLPELLGPSPRYEDHVRANRVLLEKAFPNEIAKTNRHAARLSKALNAILARRDFYRPPDTAADAPPGRAGGLLARGVDALTQDEVERLNRFLLEEAFPREIAERLIDRQYEDRLAYFLRTARHVYFKHAKRSKERPTGLDPGAPPGSEEPAGGQTEAVWKLLSEKFLKDLEDFVRRIDSSREYACLMDCCRKHQKECELMLKYYQPRPEAAGPEGESEAGAEAVWKSKHVRRKISEDEGVSPKVIKSRVYRAKMKLRACVVNCLEKEIKGRRRFLPGGD